MDPRLRLVIAHLAVSHFLPSSFVPTNHRSQERPAALWHWLTAAAGLQWGREVRVRPDTETLPLSQMPTEANEIT